MPENEEQNSNRKRIEALELDHIAQEHRILHLLRNVWENRNSDNDRFLVASKALGFRLLFLLMAGGTVLSVGLFGLWFAWKANELIKEQNYLVEAERRSALIFELSAIMDQISDESKAWNLMDEEARSAHKETLNYDVPADCSGWDDNYCLRGVPISAPLIARISALSGALQPYRYLDPRTGSMTDTPRSPERGQLLVALVNAGVYLQPIFRRTSFQNADLTNLRLSDADLTDVDLSGSAAMGAVFNNVKFLEMSYGLNVDFRGAIFCSVTFGQFVLHGSEFSGAVITGGDVGWLLRSDADGARFAGVQLIEAGLPGYSSEPDLRSQIETRFGVLPIEVNDLGGKRWVISNTPRPSDMGAICRGRPSLDFGGGGFTGFSGGRF